MAKAKYTAHAPKAQPILHYHVLMVLEGFMRFYKKGYCYPSQDKILERLKNRFHYHIERRQLNYVLRFLVDSGQIERTKRHYEKPGVGMMFRSTLYKIEKKGWKLLGWIKRISQGLPFRKSRSPLTGPNRGPGNKKLGPFGAEPSKLSEIIGGQLAHGSG